MKKALSLSMLLVLAPACFGSFALERKIWAFNKGVSPNKFVQELVYLGLVIIPVYEVGGIADALIFNLIEFWSGNNPIATASDARGEPVVMARTDTGLRLETAGGDFNVAIGEDFVEVRDGSGKLLRRVAAVDGIAIATGADGRMRALGNLDELWAGTFGDRGRVLAAAR